MMNDGIRFYKVVDGNRTDFLIDSNQTYQQVLQERDSITGTLIAQYTYGHDLLAQHNPTYGPAYYHYDAQLSTRFLTDPTTNIVNTYEYSASGPFLTRNEPFPNPFTYTGEWYDDETEFIYLRARFLSLILGRFISKDICDGKIMNPMTLNKYIYALNNPVMYVDLSGEFISLALFFASAAVQAVIEKRKAIMEAYKARAGKKHRGSYFMNSGKL